MVSEWCSGYPETPCGRGSMWENTEQIREIIPRLINVLHIRSINDIGCGDRNWIDPILPDRVQYNGWDLFPRHPETHELNIARSPTPIQSDLVLCIYVLNHLPPKEQKQAVKNLLQSGRFLLISYAENAQAIPEHPPMETYFHKNTGRHVWWYGLWKANF